MRPNLFLVAIALVSLVSLVALVSMAGLDGSLVSRTQRVAPGTDAGLVGAAYAAPMRITCGDRFGGIWQLTGVYQATVGAQNTNTDKKYTGVHIGECIGTSGWYVDGIGPGWCTYRNGQVQGNQNAWADVHRDVQGCFGIEP